MNPDRNGNALGALPGTNLVEYYYPLREGGGAYLTLPRDLQLTEIARLRAFMLALVDVNETQYPDAVGVRAPHEETR